MKWKYIPIDEIKSAKKYSLVGGPFGSDLTGEHYVDSGVPVIRGTNLPFDQKFRHDDFVFVTNEKANKLISNTAYPGDLIFTQRGTLGQVGIVPSGCFDRYIISQSQMKLTVDPEKADPLFVYYYFRTKQCVAMMENLALQSGVPHINLGILKRFKIPSPPLNVQRKISFILSAYDDLIENNKRRIKLLEEMAEEIYNEWFVRFRFPGYESVRFFDEKGKEVQHGISGALPEGWEIQPFDKVAEYVNGFAFKPTDWGDNGLPIIKINELKNGVEASTPRNDGHNIPKKYHVYQGDLLFSWSADLNVYIWNEGNGLLNQHIFKVVPNPEIPKGFLFYSLKSKMVSFRGMSNGATMHHIKKSALSTVHLNVPTMSIMNKFQSITEPMMTNIGVLKSKTRLLQEIRDLLLPRLVSGKLSVERLHENEGDSFALAAEPDLTYG